MLTDITQRWNSRRASYLPMGEPIRTRDYEVAPIDGDTEAKRFIIEHHYSASFPAARFRYGLYRSERLVGVAVFSQPIINSVFAPLRCDPGTATELGRFVLLDEVPANGESWFIARTYELIRREGIEGVVMFSDPTPRESIDGSRLFRGHIGTIYQATNAVYAGRSTARTLRLLPDGTVFSARAQQKIRKRERGWAYAVAQLVSAGAPEPTSDAGAWLREWMPRVTRTLRHPGNHRYLFGLTSSAKRRLPASMPYPKFGAPAVEVAA